MDSLSSQPHLGPLLTHEDFGALDAKTQLQHIEHHSRIIERKLGAMFNGIEVTVTESDQKEIRQHIATIQSNYREARTARLSTPESFETSLRNALTHLHAASDAIQGYRDRAQHAASHATAQAAPVDLGVAASQLALPVAEQLELPVSDGESDVSSLSSNSLGSNNGFGQFVDIENSENFAALPELEVVNPSPTGPGSLPGSDA